MRRWVPAAALLLAAVPALGSNMGVALRVELSWTPQRFHVISLPYLDGPATAEGLCQDLGAGRVEAVLRWDEGASGWVAQTCGSGSGDFALSEGEAYGVRLAQWQTVAALLAGRHDDAFVFDLPSGAGSDLHWVSLPYHLALPDAGGVPGSVDAEDLCVMVGPALRVVVRWDAAGGRYEAYLCGSAFATPFVLEQGVGYGLVNADGETVTGPRPSRSWPTATVRPWPAVAGTGPPPTGWT